MNAPFNPLSLAELHTLLASAIARKQMDFASRIADRILTLRQERRDFALAARMCERKP